MEPWCNHKDNMQYPLTSILLDSWKIFRLIVDENLRTHLLSLRVSNVEAHFQVNYSNH